jgi:ATP-dependent Clp protease ATP-binding subunit ClpX
MKAKMPARCSFCTRPQSPKIQMIEGNNHHICWRCIKDSYELIKAKNVDKHEPSPTPKMIHEYLDQYVIGQEEAKKTLSVAVFSHYKKLQSTIDIDKSNILLIGNTGSGKKAKDWTG